MAKEIPLTRGRVALIDDEDLALVAAYKWNCSTNGYAVAGTLVNGKKGSILMHRLIMGFPDSLIDHISGDKLDCRKANLRLCTFP